VKGTILRFAPFYVGVFGVLGVALPFWPIYLQSKGLGPVAIGWLLAAPYLVKVISNPLAGRWADFSGDRRTPLRWLALSTLLCTLGYFLADAFLPLLVVTVLVGGTSAALIPLSDSLTLKALSADYGRVRLWGSLGFVAAAMLSGRLLQNSSPDSILWTTLALMAYCLPASLLLPRTPEAAPAASGGTLRGLRFPAFLAATSLLQLSHMIYYGFSAILWRGHGLSDSLIGALWAEGVIAEAIFFANGALVLRFVTPRALLGLSALGGIVRWTLLSATFDPPALAALQALHALTYGACHLGAMQFIHRQVPAELSARAQGIYTASATGLAQGLTMLGAGALFELMGARAFLPMAAASLLSLPLIGLLRPKS